MIAVLLLAACHSGEHHESLAERIAASTAEPATVDGALWVEGIEADPFVGAADEADDFLVHRRTGTMRHYPCATCHATPPPEDPQKRAHWDVEMQHASADVMNCTTCHDQGSEMTELSLIGGRTVPLDQAYALCGQCHFQQLEDWRIGAHGKRLHNWAPPRIIENCTGCHNPHSPAHESRWPATRAKLPHSR